MSLLRYLPLRGDIGKRLGPLIIGALLMGGHAQHSVPAQPPGIYFDATLSYTVEGDLTLSYALTNGGAQPLIVDPENLVIYYGLTPVPYRLVRSPAPGRANRLSLGETEHGLITVSNPPLDSDNLQLLWSLFEIGPNTEHILLRRFGDMITGGHSDSGNFYGRKRASILGQAWSTASSSVDASGVHTYRPRRPLISNVFRVHCEAFVVAAPLFLNLERALGRSYDQTQA